MGVDELGTAAVRRAAVAGLFYARTSTDLSKDVRSLLTAARPRNPGRESPKALIVPHAGYEYSGPVAASAFSRLSGRPSVRRVVLIGPAHRVPVQGLALPAATAFETPLGRVPLDVDAMRDALTLPQVWIHAAAHAGEHSLEVQLPFLQTVLAEFKLVPLLVGDATAADVAAVLDRLWNGIETLIVVSSDLSHYHRYADAQAIDAHTVSDILTGQRAILHDEACGATPINGLVQCIRGRGLSMELLDLRNSGDTAGDRTRVVGYAAFAIGSEPGEMELVSR